MVFHVRKELWLCVWLADVNNFLSKRYFDIDPSCPTLITASVADATLIESLS